MGSVLWDMFSGSSPYKDIFFRTLHPAFLLQYSAAMGKALLGLPVLHADESKSTQLTQIK